ncbi:MAG: DEAD/DEAH box helicase [Syntrophobacteraceae bacterium]|jgi:superfamily II DNA/RNA helicase|nr:DEAD/DEAH box helicase [Syntrophobacteraceae bacterium]
MSFEELQLATPILKALARCGHSSPTPVQAQAIPKALAGHDLIASAQTGTGKTAAFVLPALQRLAASTPGRKPGLRVLVLTPTRELATQITASTRDYSRYLKVHSVAIYGGMPFGDQIRALAQFPDMIIATPGRLIDHIWRGRIDLSQVEMLILDEADRMLDMGFIDDMEFISDAMPPECQTLLFAATMGNATARLAGKFTRNPERVEIAPGQMTHDRIEQRLHLADGLQHKNRLLKRLCEDSTLTRAIVFSATKKDADGLARELSAEGHSAAALHADMTQSARNRTLVDMRRGRIRLLVATDVAARGLDITGISHVINFDLPRSAEDYVNRIGRTGRAGESGIAISLASRGDLPYLDRIESYLGRNLVVHVIPGLEPAHPVSRGKDGRKGDSGSAGRGGRSGGPSGGKRFGPGSAVRKGAQGTGTDAAANAKQGAPQRWKTRNGEGASGTAPAAPGAATRKPSRKAHSQQPEVIIRNRSVS